jgi:hypothetical protein
MDETFEGFSQISHFCSYSGCQLGGRPAGAPAPGTSATMNAVMLFE